MDPEPSLIIEVVEESGDWSAIDVAGRVGPIGRAIEKHLNDTRGHVALALADDATVRDLNRRFRGQDKPTNVLSFPGDTMDFPNEEVAPPGSDTGGTPLGDVILAVETLTREAAGEGKSADDHFTHLVVHGILHLLGYDHDSNEDAEEMEQLETSILATLDIAGPYAEPAATASEVN